MSKIKIKFRALIEKTETARKKVAIVNERYYHHLVNKFEIGEEVWITIENKKSHRSGNQNRLYWLYLTTIAEYTGHTEEELHDYCKQTYLPKRHLILQGKEVSLIGSTAKLSKGEFVEYTFHVQTFAESLGIKLPNPADLDIAYTT